MRKYVGYIPAVAFCALYFMFPFTGAGLVLAMILVWLACFFLAAVMLHKGII